MGELYVLAYFDDDGNFIEYVRKGRNHAISGYDNLTSAKRGYGNSKTSRRANIPGYNLRIVKSTTLEIIKEDE